MSFVLVSAEDIHYGPTSISTEDSGLYKQISTCIDDSQVGSDLTISLKTARSPVNKFYLIFTFV